MLKSRLANKLRVSVSTVLAASMLLSVFPAGALHLPSFSLFNTSAITDTSSDADGSIACLQKTMTDSSGNKYTFYATCAADSGIPSDAELDVKEIPAGAEYDAYLADTQAALESSKIGYAHFFDISIVKDGVELQPEDGSKVNMQIILEDADTEDLNVVHFPEAPGNGNAEVVENTTSSEGAATVVGFDAEGFSVYGIVSTVVTTTIDASDGHTYKITATFAESSGIPADAELMVSEISDDEFLNYLTSATEVLGETVHSVAYGKFFDISLVKDGVSYQPVDGSTVKVKVELLDTKNVDDVKVVHFEGSKAEELSASTKGTTVSFETDGFSVFSFLDFSLISRYVTATIDKVAGASGTKSGTLYSNDDIIISGSMPSTGIVEAKRVDVSVDGKNALVAYDIKIYANELMKALGITWQPSESTLQVQLKSDALLGDTVDVYHMADTDSPAELVTGNLGIKDKAVIFKANSFSVYVVVAHEGGEVVTPRVEFHFIGNDFTGDSNPYTASPYNFVNKHGDYQTTQIIKSGEKLEQINNPANLSIDNGDGTTSEKFFYGWYTVEADSDSTTRNSSSGLYTGSIAYNWTLNPTPISFTDALSISTNDDDGDGTIEVGETLSWTLGEASGSGFMDADGSVHVYLAPVYQDFYFVNFRMGAKEDTTGLVNQLLTRKLVVFGDNNTATIRIGNIECPSPDAKHLIFIGWETVVDETANPPVRKEFYQTLDTNGNEINSAGSSNGYYITIEKPSNNLSYMNMYPVYAEARWMFFNTGKSGNGASYVSAAYRVTVDEYLQGGSIPSGLSKDYYADAAFFQGSNEEPSHLPIRAGYAFEGWYIMAKQDQDGNISNLNTPADVTVNYLQDSTEVSTTVNTTAIKVINADGTIALNDGYKYQINANGQTITLFEVKDGKLYFYKAMDDLTFYANWTLNSNTTYRVIVWKQKVTDDKYATDSEKQYDYEIFYTSNNVSTTTVPDLTNFSGTYIDDSGVTQTVSNLNLQNLSWTGFHYAKNDISVVGVPEADGSSVYNVYYDRNLHRFTFQDSSGYSYTETTSNSGTQYAVIDGQWTQLTYDSATGNWTYPERAHMYSLDNTNGTYGLVDGKYVKLTMDYRKDTVDNPYTYTSTTSNSGTQYGIVDGSIQQVYYANRNWRITNTNSGTRYNGSRYTRSDNTSTEAYNGNVYTLISGTAGNGQSGFETATQNTNSNNLYGNSGSAYFGIVFSGYSYMGEEYAGDRYSYDGFLPTGNTLVHNGPRFTRSNQTYGNRTVYYIEALYGQSVSQYFPIPGYENGERWQPQSNNQGWSQVMVVVDAMPDEDITFVMNNSTNSAKTMNYYVEALPGDTVDQTYNGVDYVLYNQVFAKYNFITSEDYLEISGFTKNGSYPTINGNTYLTNYNDTIDFYYLRNLHDLTFDVNYPTDISLTYGHGQSSNLTVNDIRYGESILPYGSSYDNASQTTHWYYGTSDSENTADNVLYGPDHYIFEGWYEDKSCTKVFDFDSTMPDGNKIVYAKWTPERFRVLIDPNGGEIDHVNHNYSNNDYSGYPGMSTFNRTQILRPDGTIEREADSGYNRSQSTYINATYNTIVSEYTVERNFVPINDELAATYTGQIYYYINTQYMETDGSGLPSDCRNAIYVTEDEIEQYYNFYRDWTQGNIDGGYITGTTVLDFGTWKSLYVSTQKYRGCSEAETYTFLGWYKVVNGVMDTMPYNFSDPVKEPFTLKAMWRLDGGYSIRYIPEYTMPSDGAIVNGEMEVWTDPPTTGLAYSDGAATQIYKAPTGLKVNGTAVDDDSVIFLGWQLVNVTGTANNPVYIPIENGVYYDPADPYAVDAACADLRGVIYFQAVYQYKDESNRRPEVTNLILDANSADGVLGYINTSDPNSLPAWNFYPGVSTINTDTNLDAQGRPTQILFGDIQSSAAVHLYKYATEITEDASGNPLSDAHQYFEHPNGYLLLGFDDDPAEGDYIATYPSDSVIAVTRNDRQTIYAVWEPMVYLTVVNDTIDSAHGDVTFALSSTSSQSLYVVNKKAGIFDRVAISDLGNITVPYGESVELAIPLGALKDVTISGTNTLGTGYVLNAVSVLGSDTNDPKIERASFSDVQNNEAFSLTDTLVVDEKGIVVTFTAEKNPHTLVLDDNYTGGTTQEISFFERADSHEVYEPTTNSTSYVLPSTSTRVGYEFVGWATDPNATTAEYSATSPSGSPWTIADLTAFFTSNGSSDPDIEIKTLYAVWKTNADSQIVYVYKNVPEPGNQNKIFKFNVSYSGTYTYRTRTGSFSVSSPDNSTFELKHGQYLKLTSSKHVGNSTTRSYMQIVVQKFDADGVQVGSDEILRWECSDWTSYYNYITFTSTNISVSEADYSGSYYDTSVQVTGQYSDVYPITASQPRSLTWTNTDAGGTAIFTNTRRTADVTVKKNLVSNNSNTGIFSFHASYTLVEDGTTTVEDLGDFTVTSGSNGYVLPDIPVNSDLIIREFGTNLNDYVTTVTDGAANNLAVTTSSNTSGNTTVHNATISKAISDDDTITFTNTLKSYPVTFKLVDQDGNTTINGMFSLASTQGTIGNALYASATSTNPPAGVFYTNNTFWVDTYTLNQTVIPEGYIGLDEPVEIQVTADGIFCNNENVTITGNATDGYVIAVRNWAQKVVTIKKILEDPLLTSTRQFTFNYSYIPYGETNAVTGTFTISPVANDANGATYQLAVPVKASLTVTELNSGTYETIGKVYDTSSTGYWNITGNPAITDADTLNGNIFEIAPSNGTTGGVENDSTIVFVNTRKTVDVTVQKYVTKTGGNFTFTALLQNGSTPINGFVMNENGTPSDTTDDLVTNANGEAVFVLYADKTTHGEIVLTIPYGANLTVTETDTGSHPYSTTWELNGNGVTNSSVTTGQINVTEDLTITFTNDDVLIAPTGFRSNTKAYDKLLILGFVVLMATVVPRRKRKEEEEVESDDKV